MFSLSSYQIRHQRTYENRLCILVSYNKESLLSNEVACTAQTFADAGNVQRDLYFLATGPPSE